MPADRRAAFIDRDGVINAEHHYVYRIDDFEILPEVYEGLRLLQDAGYALVVVTNQAGIARGYYGEADFQRLTAHMQALFTSEGIRLTAVYHCPHHPQGGVPALAIECDCRKPAPGMLLQAAREHKLDLSRSVLVGDKLGDIQAGRAAGVECAVLVRSGHALAPHETAQADHTAAGLLEAAQWITAKTDTSSLQP